MPQLTLTRAVYFSSAYAYSMRGVPAHENALVYGRWHAPDGRGCNFRVECSFEGEVDSLTGMLVDLAEVDAWMKAAADEFDHRDISESPRLAGKPATADALAMAFHAAVEERMTGRVRLARTRVREGAHWTSATGPALTASEK